MDGFLEFAGAASGVSHCVVPWQEGFGGLNLREKLGIVVLHPSEDVCFYIEVALQSVVVAVVLGGDCQSIEDRQEARRIAPFVGAGQLDEVRRQVPATGAVP